MTFLPKIYNSIILVESNTLINACDFRKPRGHGKSFISNGFKATTKNTVEFVHIVTEEVIPPQKIQ